MKMSNEQIEQERRSGRIAGIIGLIGVVLYFASLGLAADFSGTTPDAGQLALFREDGGALLARSLVQAASLLCFIPALFVLFRACRMRSADVRPGLIGLTVVAPVLLAISLVVTYFAFDATADTFFDPANGLDTGSDEVAKDTFLEEFLTQVRTGVGVAGALGLTFSVVYASLHAMRSGLMSRFWGTLGMALGIGSILFGSNLLVIFFLAISLLVAGVWPQGRPPAWDAGVAMPWPKPGEVAAVSEPEEPARPEDFEGSEDLDGSAGSGATALSAQRPSRRDNKRKRKRKQRS